MRPGNHPANYKGCAVFKKLQASKYPLLRERKVTNMMFSNTQLNTNKNQDKLGNGNSTYADVAGRNAQRTLPVNNEHTQAQSSSCTRSEITPGSMDLKTILEMVMSQLVTITKMLTDS